MAVGVHRVGPVLLNFDKGDGRSLEIGKPEPAATVALADLFEGSDCRRIDSVHQSVGAPRGSISLGSQRRQTSQARKTVGFRLGLEATPFGLCPFDIALGVVEEPEGDGNPGDQCDIVRLAREAPAAPAGVIMRYARFPWPHPRDISAAWDGSTEVEHT